MAAIATNMRVTALFMFGLLGLLYIITLTVKKQWSAKNLWLGITAVVAFVLISYLVTPAAWRGWSASGWVAVRCPPATSPP